MGVLRKGMIDGSFVMRSPALHIYATANMNKIIGEMVVLDLRARRVRVWEVESKQS